jgi:hypothetical protein
VFLQKGKRCLLDKRVFDVFSLSNIVAKNVTEVVLAFNNATLIETLPFLLVVVLTAEFLRMVNRPLSLCPWKRSLGVLTAQF